MQLVDRYSVGGVLASGLYHAALVAALLLAYGSITPIPFENVKAAKGIEVDIVAQQPPSPTPQKVVSVPSPPPPPLPPAVSQQAEVVKDAQPNSVPYPIPKEATSLVKLATAPAQATPAPTPHTAETEPNPNPTPSEPLVDSIVHNYNGVAAQPANAPSAPPAPEAEALKPQGVSYGNSEDPAADIVSRYEQEISLWLEQNKRYINYHASGKAVVRIRIDRQGVIQYYKLERGTGNPVLDQAVVDIIQVARRVPPMPANYPSQDYAEFLIPITLKAE